MNRRVVGSTSECCCLCRGWSGLSSTGAKLPFTGILSSRPGGQTIYASYPHLARDIQYSPAFGMGLDVYSPAEGENHPVLIIDGGGWDKYDRKLFAPVGQKLVEQGIVVAIPTTPCTRTLATSRWPRRWPRPLPGRWKTSGSTAATLTGWSSAIRRAATWPG